jgi:hypothetical protein
MTTPDVYLDDRYSALINALVDVPPCPVTGERTADQVQQVLCDFGIWPRSILGDVIRARIEAGKDELSNVVRL